MVMWIDVHFKKHDVSAHTWKGNGKEYTYAIFIQLNFSKRIMNEYHVTVLVACSATACPPRFQFHLFLAILYKSHA